MSESSSSESETESRKLSRAEKKQAREQAKRDEAEAQAAVEAETLDKVAGFRFFRDGTVQRESGILSTVLNQRSVLLDASFLDQRKRKSRMARTGMAVATGGANLVFAQKNKSHAELTVVTEDWTATATTNKKDDQAYFDVNELAKAEAVAAAAMKLGANAQHSDAQPAPAEQSSVELLRELKQLHLDGLLTDEEFEIRRLAIVDRLG